MKEPLVTVVVPCYNHERYVQECLQSIIDQEYKNIELLIIDDGSKDDSVKKIQEMLPACQARFERVEFRARPNKGLSATLNEALELTHGKYFSTVGSDDILYSDKLTKQVAFLENESEECLAIFGGIEFIDEFSQRIKIKNNGKKICLFDDVFIRDRKCFLPAPSCLIRTSKIRDIGGYDNKCSIEDFYMWLKLLEGGGFFVCKNEVMVKYRRHNDNLSKKRDIMWTNIVHILNNYKSHPKYNAALAAAMLTQANCIQTYNKVKSIKWAYHALHEDPHIFFSLKIYIFLFKFFLPRRQL